MANANESKKKQNKPTREEIQKREEYALRMLRKSFRPCDVTSAIRRKFKLDYKASERLLKKVQKQLIEERQARTQENEVDISVDVFKEAIIEGWKSGNLKAVISANIALAKLLGLDKIHDPQEVDEQGIRELVKEMCTKSAPELIEGETNENLQSSDG